MSIKKIASLGMLAAISIVGVMLVRFSIFPQVAFLEYDPADIPIFIATFAFGTVQGLILTVVVSFIQGITVSAGSGGLIGIVMHILATGSFVLVAGMIYSSKKTRKRAYVALLAGVLVMTVTMTLWNLLITPIHMGMPHAAILPFMPFIIAFNIIKAGINAFVTALVYKKVHKQIDRFIK